MATLAELVADVYTLTNRPDLVAETQLAVRKATLKVHSADFWPRDLVETNLVFSSPQYAGQLDIVANFPRMRAIQYIREYNSTGHSGVERYLTKISPDSVMDEYAIEQTNIFYTAGSVINWKGGITNMLGASWGPYNGLTVGYYRNPDVSVTGYNSWVADNHPFVIEELAAADILDMVGKLDTSNKLRTSANEGLLLLRQNYLEGVAR